MKPDQLPSFMSIGSIGIEFKEKKKKKNMDKIDVSDVGLVRFASSTENGLRQRRRTQVTPHNASSLPDVQLVVKFILQYTEDHAILLPGRVVQIRPTLDRAKPIHIKFIN